MNRDPIGRRRQTRLVVGVLTVGIVMSVLVAVMLFYLGNTRPHF